MRGTDADYEIVSLAQQYLASLQSGSDIDLSLVAAWGDFFDTLDPMVKKYALCCGTPRVHLDECVQEVWVCVMEDLPHFDCDPRTGLLQSWLYHRVRSSAVRLFRQRCENREQTGSSGVFDSWPSVEQEPYQICEEASCQSSFEEALDRLADGVTPTNYRVFVLRKLYEQSTASVAQELGLTESQVSKRLSRAMGVFVAIIQQLGRAEHFLAAHP